MKPAVMIKKAKPFLAEGIKLERLHNQARSEMFRIEAEQRKWKEKLNNEFGTDALEFSNVCCDVFVGGHVYSPGFYRGAGQRHCIFCGLDDFDF